MDAKVINEAALELIKIRANYLQDRCHGAAVNSGWWSDLETGERKQKNVGELLMLVVSEIAEAMEGHRKNLMDDKLPHRKMVEVELADALIRIFDMAGGLGLDIGGAMSEKLEYNQRREDHKIENRKLENGKKY
jgi:NTP pyrophosphatase (non-canonical NTP hydrolase)